ncbi:MAG TPA: beta-ketoacyl synthase N-terminal-like domain-containing protein [Pyrinomonadaceae bacterium]|nr:beta-ketoacyl synthase N-terminal-like domain-containing protein [Pyrinomonadaceae bacterium]
MANDGSVAISGIGLATPQENSPRELPWTPSKWSISRICYPAVDATLSGGARWQALVKKAFANLGPLTSSIPLFVGSCNGDASRNWESAFDTSVLLEYTPWANERLPVFSSSCASGLHALYAAKQLITAGAIDEALVLAADILSQSNHDNFESLRVLGEGPSAPWQSPSRGFILGEAAVILKLVREEDGNFSGPELGSDLLDYDGLSSLLEAFSPQEPSIVLAQGTGPYGHTLGASGLLSVALAAQSQSVLVTCRAMNGACAATMVGGKSHGKSQRRERSWWKSARPGPLMNQTLRKIASEALEHRPSEPPDIFILRMEKPLSPPPSAVIGGRLLPSAVLEITPGFASQLVARCWGFSGPSLCIVGDVDRDPYGLRNSLNESGSKVFQVNLRGSGENRVIEWNV